MSFSYSQLRTEMKSRASLCTCPFDLCPCVANRGREVCRTTTQARKKELVLTKTPGGQSVKEKKTLNYKQTKTRSSRTHITLVNVVNGHIIKLMFVYVILPVLGKVAGWSHPA